MQQAAVLETGGEPFDFNAKELCLLSLDGGGVRGFSTLYILKGIMERLNGELRKEPALKLCDLFDLIGGTSTGGVCTPLPYDRD
jgi:patatin-like phospholipase/acyl hydrolase